MSTETLQGILLAGIVVCVGLAFYLIRLIFNNLAGVKVVAVPVCEVGNGLARTWLQEKHLIDLINYAHQGTGFEYSWVGPVYPKGEIVLAWREWKEATGSKDRALDVLFIKEDGSVETLGTGVEYEVFGPPEEK